MVAKEAGCPGSAIAYPYPHAIAGLEGRRLNAGRGRSVVAKEKKGSPPLSSLCPHGFPVKRYGGGEVVWVSRERRCGGGSVGLRPSLP